MFGKGKTQSIQEKVQIDDLNTVTAEEFKKIYQLFAEKKISKEELEQLVKIIPNFIELQVSYIDGLKTAMNGVKEVQKEALWAISKNLDGCTEILKSIAERAQTEELMSKVVDVTMRLAEIQLEASKILQSVNKDNMDIWKQIIGFSAIGVIVFGAIFINNRVGGTGLQTTNNPST